MEIVLDRGFLFVDSVRIVSKIEYTMATSIVRKEVKALFSKAVTTMVRPDNVIMHDGNSILYQKVSLQIEEHDLTDYFTTTRRGNQRRDWTFTED